MSDVMKFGKKLFTWSVVAMTIAWSVGLSALLPAGSVLAATVAVEDVEAGDLIKLADQSAVYYVNEDMERMYFAFAWLYKTWYSNYDGIKTLAAGTDLDEHFPPASRGAVSPRPGSCETLKSPASPAVYAVSYDGVRHRIASEEAAVALCGADWAKHVHDLPDFIISLFPLGGELDGSAPFPGQLIRTEEGGSVYVVGSDSMAYLVDGPLPTFLAGDVRMVTQAQWDALAGMGEGTRSVASLTEDVAQMSQEPGGNGDDDEPSVSGGDLRVSLAGVSPEADVVPGGAQNVPYLAVALEAEDGDVDVESITFSLGGIGDEDDFDKVYLYHDGMRLDNGRSLNSDGEVTFNFDITVEDGDTEILWVKADMETVSGTATAGDQNRFELRSASDVEASGDVAGSFPIRGNLMVVGAQDIGTVNVTAASAGATSQVKIGENEFKVGDLEVAASGDDVHVTSITLEQKGSADIDALSNFVLKRSGTTLAEGMVHGEQVTFEFESADEIQDGEEANYRVYADVGIADVNDTIQFVLDEDSDLSAYSEDFAGYEVGVSSSLNTTNALTVTVEGGKINVDIEGSNSEVRPDQNDAEFGVFTILATAEDLDIDQLDFTINKGAGTAVLEDMKLRDLNGRGTYSLTVPTAIADADTTGTVRIENLVLNQGVQYEFAIIGDVPSDVVSTGTYHFTWAASRVDAEGVSSGNTVAVDDFSSASLTGPTMSVDASSLVVRASALTDDTVVNGSKNVLMFRGTLEAGDTSDVIITEFTFGSSTHSAEWDNRIDSLRLFVAGANDTIDPTGTPLDTDNSVSSEEAVFDGLNLVVESGSANRLKFEVYADITNGSTVGTVDVQLEGIEAEDMDGEDVAAEKSDGTALSAGALTTDRDITIASSGSLTMTVDTDYTGLRNDTYALAGSDKHLVGRVKLQADQEDVSIKDLVFFASTSAGTTDAQLESTIDSLSLYSNPNLSEASLLATADFADVTTTFDGVNYSVVDGQTSYLYVAAALNSVGTAADGTAVPTASFKLQLSPAAAQDVEGVSSHDDITPTIGSTLTKEVTVVPVKLTSVSSTFAGGTLTGGNQTLFSFNITADSGENTDENGESLGAILTRMDLELTSDLSATPTAATLCRVDTNDCINLSFATGTIASGADLETDDDGYVDFTDFANSANVIDDGETVEFVVKATVASEDDSFVQVRINDINSTGGLQYGVDEDDDGTADYTYSDVRLDVRTSDYPDVIGASRSN